MARYAALPDVPPPLTPEDLYAFHFLADAEISPDGDRVAYTVKVANDIEWDGSICAPHLLIEEMTLSGT